MPTYRPITAFGEEGFPNATQFWGNMATSYNGYWIVMSQYMTDQEGIDALADVFYSPSDTNAKSIRDERSRPFLQENEGRWPGLGAELVKTTFRTPSYRYVTAGVLTPKAMDVDQFGDPKGTPGFDLSTKDISNENYEEEGFYAYVRRLPSASVDFPSQKVTFFLQDAVHNSNRSEWFEPGAICPVSMADGSARETQPDRDAIDGRVNWKIAVAERAGSWLTVVYTYSSDDPDQEDVTVNYYMPYIVTRGGMRGRDL